MTEKRKVGRPTKKTDERRNIILNEIQQVPINKIACQAAKIDPKTLERWLADDPEFCLEFQYFKSIGQRKLIDDVSRQDPHKILKASDRETFADSVQHEVGGKGGEPIKIIIEEYGKVKP